MLNKGAIVTSPNSDQGGVDISHSHSLTATHSQDGMHNFATVLHSAPLTNLRSSAARPHSLKGRQLPLRRPTLGRLLSLGQQGELQQPRKSSIATVRAPPTAQRRLRTRRWVARETRHRCAAGRGGSCRGSAELHKVALRCWTDLRPATRAAITNAC